MTIGNQIVLKTEVIINWDEVCLRTPHHCNNIDLPQAQSISQHRDQFRTKIQFSIIPDSRRRRRTNNETHSQISGLPLSYRIGMTIFHQCGKARVHNPRCLFGLEPPLADKHPQMVGHILGKETHVCPIATKDLHRSATCLTPRRSL